MFDPVYFIPALFFSSAAVITIILPMGLPSRQVITFMAAACVYLG
ncbi:hypothetical protein [Agriterribacter sp.]|nr:hypothetical protein [Agriterribacter sp.]HTN08061.1 hypothetical protein [Agriterribacter sp.]